MRSSFNALKLIMLFSIPVFSGYAFGDPAAPGYVYLSCVDKDNKYLNKSYANNNKKTFPPFLIKYGMDNGIIIKTAKEYNGGLYFNGDLGAHSNFITYDYASKEEPLKGYAVFKNWNDANTFCEGLSNLCKATFDDAHNFAMGGVPGVSGFYKISVMYKDGSETKHSVCPNPEINQNTNQQDYLKFPNSGGAIPG